MRKVAWLLLLFRFLFRGLFLRLCSPWRDNAVLTGVSHRLPEVLVYIGDYDVHYVTSVRLDETQLVGLKGVVKISHIVCNGICLLRLDGFAAASRWQELSPANLEARPQIAAPG
jgi:hypothetical protein